MSLERALFPFGSNSENPRSFRLAVSPAACAAIKNAKSGESFVGFTKSTSMLGIIEHQIDVLEKFDGMPDSKKLKPLEDWAIFKITEDPDIFSLARKIDPNSWQTLVVVFITPDFKKARVGVARQGEFFTFEESAIDFLDPVIPINQNKPKKALFFGVGYLGLDFAIELANRHGYRDFTFVDKRKIQKTGVDLPCDYGLFSEGKYVTEYAEQALRALGIADLTVRSFDLGPYKFLDQIYDHLDRVDLVVSTDTRIEAPFVAYLSHRRLLCPHFHFGVHRFGEDEQASTVTNVGFLLPHCPCPSCAGVYQTDREAGCGRQLISSPENSLLRRSFPEFRPVPSESERTLAIESASKLYADWTAGLSPSPRMLKVDANAKVSESAVKKVKDCKRCYQIRVDSSGIVALLNAK